MYEPIHETISVIGVYKNAKFFPRKFLWADKEYFISQITFAADIRDGSVRKRQYSVVADNNSYRLLFDRAEEIWTLEEVWCE
ncbi:MAG: hypothetical protein QG639_402 [Patescibacteria group bacterium]|jgi:hypothetical protein|nr:hypothetical protein [Patescibacteria group bacterium]